MASRIHPGLSATFSSEPVNEQGYLELKDIHPKAATDADKMGFTESQIQTALAHTAGSTTRDYIRRQDAPVSEVILKLPESGR